ncbi:hypothetical protein Q0812_10215 [Brevundimonas sp. 2R-24]|uniref:Uncharacterized protein n=1 Tax=Peiella sedimenti TaxID=3061083 RepID=A0ABT8SMK3_9CAUL|nr:hypothetical protein [Caulobacteraceae bacterium XZ-24]
MPRRLLAALRFLCRLLNILEPDVGYPVLSISKLSMWATLCLTIFMAIKNPSSAELAAALGAQVAATANYGFRRWVQMKTRKGTYGPSADGA